MIRGYNLKTVRTEPSEYTLFGWPAKHSQRGLLQTQMQAAIASCSFCSLKVQPEAFSYYEGLWLTAVHYNLHKYFSKYYMGRLIRKKGMLAAFSSARLFTTVDLNKIFQDRFRDLRHDILSFIAISIENDF